jgi:nucleoside-diphosphate-sugar epimerase
MKYLVTGGSGFLGSALVLRLLKDGHEVRVLDNGSRGRIRRLSEVIDDIDYVEGDICDPDCVAAATAGVDSVCHLAYVNGTRYFYECPERVLEVGVKGMMNVLDACLEHDIGELVLMSSSEVYQTPPTIPTPENVPLVVPDVSNPRYSYGGGKIISELLALNYGRRHFERTLIIRPHNVYGPDMGAEHVIPAFALRMYGLRDHPGNPVPFPIQGSGEETRAFVYVDDFIDGVSLVLQRGEDGGVYHVGTDNEVCIRDVAVEVAHHFGRDIEIQPSDALAGATPRRCPDISKLRALGFTPSVTLRDGVGLTADWYSRNAELFDKGTA